MLTALRVRKQGCGGATATEVCSAMPLPHPPASAEPRRLSRTLLGPFLVRLAQTPLSLNVPCIAVAHSSAGPVLLNIAPVLLHPYPALLQPLLGKLNKPLIEAASQLAKQLFMRDTKIRTTHAPPLLLGGGAHVSAPCQPEPAPSPKMAEASDRRTAASHRRTRARSTRRTRCPNRLH